MPGKPLRIAWLGPTPGGSSGVRGAAAELLLGLAGAGHRIDCFFPAAEDQASVLVAGDEQISFGEGNLAFGENVTFVWGTSTWKWGRWYSRGKVAAFVSGMVARALASLRLRREISRRHRQLPYDLVYQFSSIETPAVPSGLARSIPLVIHPETHVAGELRWMWKERSLALRSQPTATFALLCAISAFRALVQYRSIRRAKLLICISSAFREHLVHDYRFPRERTLVVPNPMRADRFAGVVPEPQQPPVVLALGRISVRKGVEDVIAVARTLHTRGIDAKVRVIGGPSLFSDYTSLLEQDLPTNVDYVGHVASAEVPGELARSSVLLQASKYEPFALTVAEALAAGVPVVGTSEVGAIEGVDRSVVVEVEPGDVEGMVAGVASLLDGLTREGERIHAIARAEAVRLFAPETVCTQISTALEALLDERR